MAARDPSSPRSIFRPASGGPAPLCASSVRRVPRSKVAGAGARSRRTSRSGSSRSAGRPTPPRWRRCSSALPVDLMNSQSARDREALTWLALRGRLRVPLVLTRRQMPRTFFLENWLAGRAAARVVAVSRAGGRGASPQGHARAQARGDPERTGRRTGGRAGAAARRSRPGASGSAGRRPSAPSASWPGRRTRRSCSRRSTRVATPVRLVLAGVDPSGRSGAARARVAPRARRRLPAVHARRAPALRAARARAAAVAHRRAVPVAARGHGAGQAGDRLRRRRAISISSHPTSSGLLVPPLDPARLGRSDRSRARRPGARPPAGRGRPADRARDLQRSSGRSSGRSRSTARVARRRPACSLRRGAVRLGTLGTSPATGRSPWSRCRASPS